MPLKQIRLIFSIVGLLVFASAGIALGSLLGQFPSVPESIHLYAMIFAGVISAGIGWFLTPHLVIGPFNRLRKAVQQVPASVILTATIGLFIGLALGAIAAYPVSSVAGTLGAVSAIYHRRRFRVCWTRDCDCSTGSSSGLSRPVLSQGDSRAFGRGESRNLDSHPA